MIGLLFVSLASYNDLCTTETTSTTGSDKTDLATSGCISSDSRSFTNMLMVTTSLGMLNGVHGDTTDFRPAVPLCLVLVVGTASLQHRFINTTASRDDTNHGPVGRGDDLLGSRGKLDTSLLGVGVVGHNCGVVAGGLGHPSTITSFLFQAAHDGTFRHDSNRENVSDLEVSLLASVDELASVHALRGNEGLRLQLVTVWVTECDLSKGSTTARVVDDVLDDTLDVAMTLSIIYSPQTSSSLPVLGMCLEYTTRTLSLTSDNATHFGLMAD